MYTVVILDIQKADIVIDFPVLYKPKHLKSNLNSIVPCVRNPKGFLQCPSKNPQTFSTLILTILKVSRNKTLMCKKSVKERLESRKYYQLRSQPIVLAILYIVPKKKKNRFQCKILHCLHTAHPSRLSDSSLLLFLSSFVTLLSYR